MVRRLRSFLPSVNPINQLFDLRRKLVPTFRFHTTRQPLNFSTEDQKNEGRSYWRYDDEWRELAFSQVDGLQWRRTHSPLSPSSRRRCKVYGIPNETPSPSFLSLFPPFFPYHLSPLHAEHLTLMIMLIRENAFHTIQLFLVFIVSSSRCGQENRRGIYFTSDRKSPAHFLNSSHPFYLLDQTVCSPCFWRLSATCRSGSWAKVKKGEVEQTCSRMNKPSRIFLFFFA